MIVVPINRPMNMETMYEVAVVCSLQDPLLQQRIQISTASMSGIPAAKLPWAKCAKNHSQVSSQQGGTMEASHTFKMGDVVLVYRATASEQDWTVHGHPGSIASESGVGGAGTSTGPQNFYWNSDLKTANTQTAKPKTTKTTYPADGTATWNNPGQVMMELASDPDVRKLFDTKAKAFNYPQLYQTDVWNQAQHIIKSAATGSPVTQVIQQMDQTLIAEAQKNGQALQMLHRLRMELNTPDINGFGNQQVPQGVIKTFQSLLSGGGIPGLQGILGTIENLVSAFSSMGQSVLSQQAQQNQAMANNQFLAAANTQNANAVAVVITTLQASGGTA